MQVQIIKIIRKDGILAVSPDQTEIRRGEELQWAGENREMEFFICFAGMSPFARRHYSNLHPASGPVLYGPRAGEFINGGEGTCYKYSVEVDGQVLDPGIIVRP